MTVNYIRCLVSPNKIPRRQEGHPAVKKLRSASYFGQPKIGSRLTREYTDKYQNRRKTMMMMMKQVNSFSLG